MKKDIFVFIQNSCFIGPFCSWTWEKVPVDDADHAVLAVVGAVDAQFVQQVQQQRVEITVKLANSRFEAGIWLVGFHVLC